MWFKSAQSGRRISFKIAVILIIAVFVGGVALGGNTFWLDGRIQSRDWIQTTPQPGTVENLGGGLPTYLTKDVDFNLFWEVWDLVRSKYYQKDVPDTKLFYGSLAGIVASLDDPYSVFLTPTDTTEFENEIKGSFEGIGAEIGMKDNNLTIISPLPDSPAIKAGLRPKDIIVEINGKDASAMSLDQAISQIRGKKGTKVNLLIYREGFSSPKEFIIVRDAIVVKSVTWEQKGNVAHIKMRQFNDDTLPLFEGIIAEIAKNSGIKGIILDLRNNPGGYLQSAIDIAGEWIDSETVVSEKLRSGEEIKHRSERKARLDKYPTVVLVNGGSASASEIVAGALQDLSFAKIVGEKTFGKGSVQDLTQLEDGSSVKLTIAKWFTPKGRSIDEAGIEPDIEIELTDEDYNKDRDPQLDKAMELLK